MKMEFENISKLLINVDMVNGFVKMGSMSDTNIKRIIPEHITLMNRISDEGKIAIIKDTHKKDCREFKRYPVHCVEGEEEADLIDELKIFEENALVYEKNSTSTMYAPRFTYDLDKMTSLKEVIIIGCCTDICILNLAIPMQNYFDQKDRDIKITIPKNAVDTYNSLTHNREEYNNIAFKLMEQAGINLVESYK